MARRSSSIAVLVLIGAIGIVELIERPRFGTYHAVDVVQLVASGMCFGVALAMLLGGSRNKPPG